MKWLSSIPFFFEVFSQFLCIHLGFTKYYTIEVGKIIQYTFQGCFLVVFVDIDIFMVYVFIGFAFGMDLNLERFFHVCTYNSTNFRWHCSRKQPNDLFIRCTDKDLVDIFLKSHIKHFVSFIQDQKLYLIEFNCFSVYQILQSTRCCYQYMRRIFFDISYLCSDWCTTINYLST